MGFAPLVVARDGQQEVEHRERRQNGDEHRQSDERRLVTRFYQHVVNDLKSTWAKRQMNLDESAVVYGFGEQS